METYSLSLRKVGGYVFFIISTIALFAIVLSPSTHAKEYSSLKNDCLVLVNKQNPRDLSGATWVPCYPGMPEHAPVTGKKVVGVSTQDAKEYTRSFVENDLIPIPDPQVEKEKYYVRDLRKDAPRATHTSSDSSHSRSVYVPQYQKGSGTYHAVPRTPDSYKKVATTTTTDYEPAKKEGKKVSRTSVSHKKSTSYSTYVPYKKYMMTSSTSTYYHSQYKRSEQSTHSDNGRVVQTNRSYSKSVTKKTSKTTTVTSTTPKRPVVQKQPVKRSNNKCLLVTRYSNT